MEQKVYWLIPQRVLYVHVWGIQTVRAIVDLSAVLNAALDQGAPPVHLFIDVAGVELAEFGLDDYANAATHLRHENLGWWMSFGSDNPMFTFACKEVALRTDSRFQPAISQEHALAFLRMVDRTLPPTVAADL